MPKKWVSVTEYSKLKKLNSPQVVYNWIANGKLKKDVDWREVDKKVIRKEIAYET